MRGNVFIPLIQIVVIRMSVWHKIKPKNKQQSCSTCCCRWFLLFCLIRFPCISGYWWGDRSRIQHPQSSFWPRQCCQVFWHVLQEGREMWGSAVARTGGRNTKPLRAVTVSLTHRRHRCWLILWLDLTRYVLLDICSSDPIWPGIM